MARKLDMAVTPWGVLDGGILTGKYNKKRDESGRAQIYKSISDEKLKITAEVIKVAKEIGKTPSQVALNWVRQQAGVIIPIIGAKTIKQLKDNLECLNFTLSEEHMNELGEASKIDMGFPHEFLTSETIADIIYGGTQDKIDNHHKF